MTNAQSTHSLIYRSASMAGIVALIDRIAPTEVPVLLVGETGTGKELLAARLHAASNRTGELVDLNCGALPRDMIESLLFGHARGAFTGAVSDRRGLIALADRGTLFLDELSSLPPEGQAKLLRVLETGELRPLGSSSKIRSKFRVVAAVQSDLPARMETGDFRSDLYYRVAGVVVEIPPLRARPEDIVPLARHFAERCGRGVPAESEAVLLRHYWAGNVRELRSVIERACFGTDSDTLDPRQLTSALRLPSGNATGASRHGPGDAARLLEVCSEAGWNIDLAAQTMGISRATAYRRLARHGIRLPSLNRRVSGPVAAVASVS